VVEADAAGRRMISADELYGELWAEDESPLTAELKRSLEPRGTAMLYDAFAELGVGPDHVILDAGARDAVHGIRLVRRFGCRVVAVDPVPLHIERARKRIADAGVVDRVDAVEAGLESLPFDDEFFDYIWCRDVLNHVELDLALPECLRVLRRGGSMLAYQTFATETCEPEEAARLLAASASRAENMSHSFFEERARTAGFETVRKEQLRGEWRERMLEDGTWDPVADLLSLSRLHRRESELVERHGNAAVEAERAGLVWGIYQVLGKTCPTIYVLERRG
jgi:ubiquinone/menaquinone biosynthesis C-methylase UbiE